MALRAGGGGRAEEILEAADDPRGQPRRQFLRRGVLVGLQGGGQIPQQRRGPCVGARVRGDPGLPVHLQDRPVQCGLLRRWRHVPEQDGDQGVQEQAPAREHIGPVVADRQVERVEFHPLGAQAHDDPADGVGQAQVLVFGVDDLDPRPLVEGAQDLEFDEVGLTGAGAGDDDGVVVLRVPPVPPHDAAGVGVDPVQHPAGGGVVAGQRCRQVRGGEGERGGQGLGVHGAQHLQPVGGHRQGGGPAGQVPPRRRLHLQQRRRGGGLHLRARRHQLQLGASVHRAVQTDPKQLRRTPRQPLGQICGVVGGGLHIRIAELALHLIRAPRRFEAGALGAQPGRRDRSRQRIDVHR